MFLVIVLLAYRFKGGLISSWKTVLISKVIVIIIIILLL